MRPTTDLAKLRSAFNGRVRHIRKVVAGGWTGQRDECARALAFSVIELDNLVMGSLREFIISSLRGARTASGQRITVSGSFGGADAVAAYVMSVVENVKFGHLGYPAVIDRHREVKIRDPRLVERVLSNCHASNTISVQNALSLNTSLFSDIATVRNFYAHRNEDTWQKVRRQARNKGLLSIRHTDDLLAYQLPGRPVTLIEDWLDDAELFFHELTA
jgi:hypothetical protein